MATDYKAILENNLSETSMPNSAFETADRILRVISNFIRSQGCEIILENRELIVEAAASAFDQFIRPIDWPVLGDALETRAEDMVKEAMIDTLNSIIDACKPTEPPSVSPV